jgi:hypothetical protein
MAMRRDKWKRVCLLKATKKYGYITVTVGVFVAGKSEFSYTEWQK